MKILIVHNDYGAYSGEEAVVDKMASMLPGMGHEVSQLRMSTAGARSSIIGQMRGFAAGIYSPSGIRAMRRAIATHKPDIINIHNLYPFISPAALRECRRAGVPVVMTVHNFRLICPTGLFLRDGRPCELCLQRGNEWGCVRHNCEHSILKSIGYAARNAAARLRRDYTDCVDIFACITDFQRRKLIQAGIPADKIVVIPNSVEVGEDLGRPHSDCGYVAYCGRISREKGVDMIIEVARRNPQIEFRLAGAVRDKELVSDLPANVKLIGYLSGSDLEKFYAGSRFMVMASRWYEGFPMTILEAARHSRPMIAPDHGGFTEILRQSDDSGVNPESAIGVLFEPGDTDALEREVVQLWENPAQAAELGNKARLALETRYSPEAVGSQWQQLITNRFGSKRL
ncbi:MAG: glycosyltransferase family 4 protein [Muribaculaceae bacterium]|nr:glycosyltransferase family 4 protein [Muribaculaceae bacterium]